MYYILFFLRLLQIFLIYLFFNLINFKSTLENIDNTIDNDLRMYHVGAPGTCILVYTILC